jgi:hypothetical protein
MKQITIEHNHGVVVLKDAELIKAPSGYQYARGVCVGGGSTSRLFGASHYAPFETGVVMDYPCHRAPYCTDADQDHWRASVVSCG